MISLAQQGSSAPPQGSEEWLQLRKRRLTGSKPANLCFELKSQEDWDRLHDEMLGDRKPPAFSDEAIARMNYGSETEDVAAELLQQNIPGSVFFEVPLIKHPVYNYIAASPDGLLIQFEHDENGRIYDTLNVIKRYNVEVKCPLFEYLSNPVEQRKKMMKKKHAPYYYMAQIHFEMVCQKTKTTLFIMYTPVRSHVWKMEFDEDYWRQTIDMLKTFKDKCCTFEALDSKVKDWIAESRRYAQRYKIWKVIEPEASSS